MFKKEFSRKRILEKESSEADLETYVTYKKVKKINIYIISILLINNIYIISI